MDSSSRTPLAAPEVTYRPIDPPDYRPPIGLIGCGGITHHHLQAYRTAGYPVVALCDLDVGRAHSRREEYFPEAHVYDDYRDLLHRDEIEVVDVTTHPAERFAIMADALCAGKHVLSQKPFVLDLDDGLRLVELADQHQVQLAVNQNARWAPHFSYMRGVVQAGLLGELSSVDFSVHWDHTWVRGTQFESIRHLVLYDYAIHWFDMVSCLLASHRPQRVYASEAHTRGQTVKPPLLAQIVIECEAAQATLAFNADTHFHPQDRSYLSGSQGTLISVGPGSRSQLVTLTTTAGQWQPDLVGCWFPDGFHGTMAELLCSIAERRRPTIDGRGNLDSLALCFAAIASAKRHLPVVPGSVRRLEE